MLFNYVDGQLLPFNEIEKDLPCHSAKLLSESKWTFITHEVNHCFFFCFLVSFFSIFHDYGVLRLRFC